MLKTNMHGSNSYKLFKKFSDYILALSILIISAPLNIIIILFIYFIDGKPIFFRQKRSGIDCQPFFIIKYRTMLCKKNSNNSSSNDEKRITKLGNLLRATSIDELPNLINVLQGNMSIIGPRPLPIEYNNLYNSFQIKRYEVKPGITGLAQVKGRNLLSWDEKFKLDVKYVESISFLLDLYIILKSISIILSRKGISSDKCATMEPFKGNN
tara:strand:+ start:680 stop:1312 length:633 start_codon:yes stop_codon:yes gene_type:complete